MPRLPVSFHSFFKSAVPKDGVTRCETVKKPLVLHFSSPGATVICITPVLADATADPLPQMSGETWHVVEGQNLDTNSERPAMLPASSLPLSFVPELHDRCRYIPSNQAQSSIDEESLGQLGHRPTTSSGIGKMDWMQVAPVYLRIGMPKTDNLAIHRSVTAGCSAASEAIAETTLALNKFVREFRESRAEIDAISTELHSLDGILALLRYDAASFPIPLAEQTPAVLSTCLGLVNELGSCVSVLNRPGLSKGDKRSRWLASGPHVDDVRRALGEYKLALSLAVDLVGVYAVFFCHLFVAWTDSYLLGSNPSQTKGTDQTCRG